MNIAILRRANFLPIDFSLILRDINAVRMKAIWYMNAEMRCLASEIVINNYNGYQSDNTDNQ